jgi:uncharacterized protein with HEPN domain
MKSSPELIISMEKSDSVRLKHMLEAARACLQFGAGRERIDLEKDQMLSFAIIRALEIFGEAASRVSDKFQQAHPQIPWRAIVGMRNRLIHAYFDVDNDIVWEAIQHEIPQIIPELEKLV